MRKTPPRSGEAGFIMLEMTGGMLAYLIMIAAGVLLLYAVISGGKLSQTEQGIVSMRMQVQQLFSGGSDYVGLDNALALKAGLVPKSFIRGTSLVTPWGGAIALAATPDGSMFTQTFSEIPQEECTRLATFQLDSWAEITVNSNTIAKSSGAASAAASCSSSNTIVFTSR